MGHPERKRKDRTVLVIVLATLVGGLATCFALAVLLVPPVIQQAREAKRRQQAAENLQQLKTALQNYHDSYPVQENDSPEASLGPEQGTQPHERPILEGTNPQPNAPNPRNGSSP